MKGVGFPFLSGTGGKTHVWEMIWIPLHRESGNLQLVPSVMLDRMAGWECVPLTCRWDQTRNIGRLGYWIDGRWGGKHITEN